MNEFEHKAVKDFVSKKFNEWKPHLTDAEQQIFYLHYFCNWTVIKISMEVNYSERNVKRILRKARKKVYKLLP